MYVVVVSVLSNLLLTPGLWIFSSCSYRGLKKCLKVRQKLGTRNVAKLALSHSLTLDMLNNSKVTLSLFKSLIHSLLLFWRAYYTGGCQGTGD